MLPLLALMILALHFAETISSKEQPLSCLNNGTYSHSEGSQTCICAPGYIGQYCNIPAAELASATVESPLSTNYSYYYFEPKEVNYYKLIFHICMLKNPSNSSTLFYVQTEKNNGSLRESPSIFQTAKIVLKQNVCTTFETHYISVKRRPDQTYRKIIVGLKVMEDIDSQSYLNTYYKSELMSTTENAASNASLIEGDQIRVSIEMSYEVYIQVSYLGTFLILFTSFVLFFILIYFIRYLRKQALPQENVNFDTLHNFASEINRIRNNNPEYILHSIKNRHLVNLQTFMPVKLYGPNTINQTQQMSQHHIKDQIQECCSICLVEFKSNVEIRTTPCNHTFHKECIDSWRENRMICPICRRQLNFSLKMKSIYYQLLKGQLGI